MADVELNVDALMPPQMADKADAIGIKKANMDFWTMFALAILAGTFIGAGAMLATVVTGCAGRPFGVTKILGGLVFCLGLILVVVGGAELFTGNNLIVMAWAGGKVDPHASCCATGHRVPGQLRRRGAHGGAHRNRQAVHLRQRRDWPQGAAASPTTKGTGLDPGDSPGALCNALVCMAVWLPTAAAAQLDKILAILFPITGFVAAGLRAQHRQYVLHPDRSDDQDGRPGVLLGEC